jgi:hypothetical protein
VTRVLGEMLGCSRSIALRHSKVIDDMSERFLFAKFTSANGHHQ